MSENGEEKTEKVAINAPFLNLLNQTLPELFWAFVNREKDPMPCWRILEGLSISMPTDMKEEWRPEIEKSAKTLQGIDVSVHHSDPNRRIRERILRRSYFLLNGVLEGHMDSFYRVLSRHGYLEVVSRRFGPRDFKDVGEEE